jgi:glucokinase
MHTTGALAARLGSSLVADVGGSNARFGWLDRASHQIRHVQSLPVAGHAGLVDAARHYLDAVRGELGGDYDAPSSAAIAVATAVTTDRVELTNSHWSFSCDEAQSALGVDTLRVLNDFEALALALPHLGSHQLRQVGGTQQGQAGAALAVVGPGTGLGVASVVPTPAGWVALPGEGGHATLAPGTDEESALLGIVRRRFPHVSAERLLSGIGLPVLHGAIAELSGMPQPDPGIQAPQIVDAGLAGDALASQTLAVFCALLGSFAGNVALTAGARGGLFIGGGIVPRLGTVFDASAFRHRFEDKGRLASYLAAIPTFVITDTLAALTGAAAALDPAVEPPARDLLVAALDV